MSALFCQVLCRTASAASASTAAAPLLLASQNNKRCFGTTAILPDQPKHREVFNQSNPLEDYNAYDTDIVLKEAVSRYDADWATDHLTLVGNVAGSAHMHRLAEQANNNPPVHRSHDRFGNRIDIAEFHPAYHELMTMGIELELPSFAWRNAGKQGSQVARSALGYMVYPTEAGTQCPQTMTYACVPALRKMTAKQREQTPWDLKSITPSYDPRDVPASEKYGVTIGMSMTERQGGSDVRANTTIATPIEGSDVEGHLLNGHKWFTSAPMCDAFLTLAQTENGLSCFLVPRWLPDGTRNTGFRISRLKSKLGDRSNASSEVEYENAYGEMLGPEGRGVPTIIEMVQHTRLDCLVGSSGLMRRCVAEALHHTANRSAFGTVLSKAPIMQNVLADLVIESEAATSLAFRVASTFDSSDKHELAISRIGTAVAKYHLCKKAPSVAYESMECHGGNGYIEEGPMPRLYRQSPLNAIWEGSGNVICLDVLRSVGREPETKEAFEKELRTGLGYDKRLDAFIVDTISAMNETLAPGTPDARRTVGMMAVAWQGTLLARNSPAFITEAFISSRIAPSCRAEYGTMPSASLQLQAIIDRAMPISSASNT